MTGITKEEMRRKLGNITQLRELLFGEQIEEYERKFDLSFQQINELSTEVKQLEGKFTAFRADMKQQLYNLENNLSQEIRSAVDSLEKKIQYLNLNTRSETKRLHQEIQEIVQSTDMSLEEMTNNLKSQTKYLKDELSQTRNDLEQESHSLKQQLTEKIEKNLVELTDGKVSRTDLAEVLFELCLKIKGTNMVSEAEENGSEKIATELLLPNKKIKA